MLHVREVNSAQQLTDLRSVWHDLLAVTPGATFFQSLDWLEAYWHWYGNDAATAKAEQAADDFSEPVQHCEEAGVQPEHLRVLVVEADRKPVGILPLVVTTEPYRVGRVRVLGYPLAGWGSFYGPIGAQPATISQAGLRRIRHTARDWDLLDLRWVDPQVDQNATPQALQETGFTFDSQLWHRSAQIELHDGWEKYWAGRKSTWRSNVRRCERLLLKRGKLEYIRYRPRSAAEGHGNPRWDLYNTCVQLAQRSWQGDSTTGTTLSHPAVREYLCASHEAAARAGAVDVNLLLLDGQPVAYSYNYHYRGWVYGIRNGYDSAAVQEGAGTVLIGKMIEDSCLRGDWLIDLGPNYLECKRYWLTRLQPAYHYTHFHPTRLRAQALRLKRIVKHWLSWSRPEPQPVAEQKSVDLLS